MKNDLQIFNNEEFGQIRTLIIESQPWFVGKDIAENLGYERADNAIRTHVDDEDKLMHQISASGQKRNMLIINESGLYSLILFSKLPQAKKFKKWVTSEVLPQIRKTGHYSTHSNKEEILLSILKTQNIILEKISKNGADTDNGSISLEIKHLAQNQNTKQTSKVFFLPKELKNNVDYMLSQENRNFSYISRYLNKEGYQISNVALSNYYKKYLQGGK